MVMNENKFASNPQDLLTESKKAADDLIWIKVTKHTSFWRLLNV